MKKINCLIISIICSLLVSAQTNIYDSLFAKYKAATILQPEKVELAQLAQQNGYQPFAHKIAQEYISGLSDNGRLLENNVKFIFNFTNSISDPGFNFIINHTSEVNQILHLNSGVQVLAAKIISKEDEAISKLPLNPEWDSISSNMDKKYGKNIADRLVAAAKVKYYKEHKNWELYAQSQAYNIEHYGNTYNIIALNNASWDVFQNCNDSDNLKLALKWLTPYVKSPKEKPNYLIIDTYANLLYKLGKSNEAIEWEKTAVEYSQSNTDFVEVLNKMQTGKKTW